MLQPLLPCFRATAYGGAVRRLPLLLLLWIAMAAPSAASLYDYKYSTGSGKPFTMDDAKQIIYPDAYDATSGVIDLGFDFEFDGVMYSQFSVNSNGLLGLGGSDVTPYGWQTFDGTDVYPVIAPFWDELITINNGVRYQVVDGEQGRVLIVDWEAFHRYEGESKDNTYHFQVRLYEYSNTIEFWYGNMATWTNTYAKIGAAADGGNFASGYFSGEEFYVDFSSTQATDLANNSISENTLITFQPQPCGYKFAGNPDEGGTSEMFDGDKLLSNIQTPNTTSRSLRPFQMYLASNCTKQIVRFAITGQYADEYSVEPAEIGVGPDDMIEPTITFTPACTGPRPATLTITGPNGFTATYQLEASGASRLEWIGNLEDGGVDGMPNGATLLGNSTVTYGQQRTFTPFTMLGEMKSDEPKKTAAVDVTYTLNDPSGQFRISPASATLMNGETSTPTITFVSRRFGKQTATLTIEGDCEKRTFTLEATVVGAGGEFTANGAPLGSGESLFSKVFECSGVSANSIAITVRSVGNQTLTIGSADFFRTDSIYGQGVPRYPLLRDQNNQPISASDYFITDFPGTAPVASNALTEFPMVLKPGESRTFYINFAPQRPGKRLARLFIPTNALNFASANADGVGTDGLVSVDMFGKGLGAQLASNAEGAELQSLSFQPTRLRQSQESTITVWNSGACDLRISKDDFRISDGDVRDFQIISAFANATVDPQSNDYIIPAGGSSTITVRFTPIRTGSRRAGLYLQTNDSARHLPNMETGAYYWDVVGVGTIGLNTQQVTLGPSVIDGPAANNAVANATVENTATEKVTIVNAVIVGPDAAEFGMNPTAPWPALPFDFLPGDQMRFSVIHTPVAGSQPGPREASLLLISNNGDTLEVLLNGEAGSRTITAGPATLFDDVSVAVGKIARRSVMITNNGTLPLQLGATTVTGPNATDYTLGRLPRLTLAPGQTEYLQVTFRPLNRGTSTATLTINSNGVNGAQIINLGGVANGIGGSSESGTSGVESVDGVGGISLSQAMPNPASNQARISYRIATATTVTLTLFDALGREVARIDEGFKSAGDHEVSFSVSKLPGGTYRYRLATATGEAVSRGLTVAN